MKNKNQITLKIQPEIKRGLKTLADREDISVSDVVRIAIREKLGIKSSFFCIKSVANNTNNSNKPEGK